MNRSQAGYLSGICLSNLLIAKNICQLFGLFAVPYINLHTLSYQERILIDLIVKAKTWTAWHLGQYCRIICCYCQYLSGLCEVMLGAYGDEQYVKP